MGEIKEKGTSDQSSASVPESGQASLVVGKIPAGHGLWGALEQIRSCDTIRNGVLVVFSPQCSGRLGVFCNSHITGGVVDATGVKGSKSIHELLSVTSGMFCFRPCFGDETAELGQQISLSIRDLLDLKEGSDAPENPAKSLDKIPVIEIAQTFSDDYLGAIEETPVESALVISSSNVGVSKESSLVPSEPPAGEEEGGDYFDWFGQATQKSETPNLRKILLPVLSTRNDGADQSEQINRDLTLYKKVLQAEEERVRKDIERTLEKGGTDTASKQTLDDMNMLAGMLQQQEQMISQRWQGLDEIPTPRAPQETDFDPNRAPQQIEFGSSPTHVDASGQVHAGAPLRTKKEFLAGCEDLISSAIRPTDPTQFLRKVTDDSKGMTTPYWMNHPMIVGIGIVGLFGVIGLFASHQWDNSDVLTLLHQGRDQLKVQHWSDAILCFNDALIKDANCSQAYFYRGIALEESGDEDGARADFKAAKNHGVPAADIAVAQAGIELRREEWQKAFDICDQAIAHGASTAAVYRLRANANLHMGAFRDAKADSERALVVCKNDPQQRAQILAERGYARIQLGEFEDGAKDFDAALKEHPDKALYMLKGDAYRKVKRFSEAIENYTKTIDLDPHYYDAYVARGMCETDSDQKALALRDFGRAIELNPNGVEALIQRGSLQLTSGAYRMALDDLQLAWDLNPTIEEARQKLMLAYAHTQKEVPKSLLLSADRQSERRKLPSDPKQLVIIGYNDMNNGDLDGAIDSLIEAVKKDPNNADARRYLAHAMARAGNFEAASSQFKALASLQSLTDEDATIYGDASEHTGDVKKAAELLLRLLVKNQDNVAVRIKLANLYYQAGRKSDGDQLAQEGLARPVATSDKEQLLELLKTGAASSQRRFQPGQPDMGSGTHG